MQSSRIKKSRYQVIPAETLARHDRPRLALRWERKKMTTNPVYYRLISEAGNFVGFKRIVTEWLPAAATRWQLDPVPHDQERTQKLSQPAAGTATLGREKIITTKKRIVTNPKSKEITCDGLPKIANEDCPEMPAVKPPKSQDGPTPVLEPHEPQIDRGTFL